MHDLVFLIFIAIPVGFIIVPLWLARRRRRREGVSVPPTPTAPHDR